MSNVKLSKTRSLTEESVLNIFFFFAIDLINFVDAGHTKVVFIVRDMALLATLQSAYFA